MKKNNKITLLDLNNIVMQDNEVVKKYLQLNCSNMNDDDVDVLIDFANLIRITDDNYDLLKGFIVGFIIKRLNREFDLLKFNDNNIINIELKESQSDLHQARNNYITLKTFYSNSNIYVYDYCKKDKKILFYNQLLDDFEEVSINELISSFKLIDIPKMIDININILSIYGNPSFFFNNEYCLSKSQESIYNEIINNLDEEVIVINGDSGTGKSLLAVYLFKELNKNGKTKLLLPIKIYDIINKELIDKYEIDTVKHFITTSKKYDYIIVDEAQILTDSNINNLKERCTTLILFGDILQDIKNSFAFKDLRDSGTVKSLNMKGIIRTDNTFVTYAKKVINVDARNRQDIDSSKIDIVLRNDDYDVTDYIYIEPLKSIYWENCTHGECSHKYCYKIKNKFNHTRKFEDIDTCSLEFDNVAIYLCDSYRIKTNRLTGEKNIVQYKKSNIQALHKELYFLMTRAINKLLIIVDDLELYNYLMEKKNELG